MTQRTILVVEDNPITRKMMCIALETESYHVLDARDGRSALELARNCPDLVLQDYVLPDMDGLQLMEACGHCRVRRVNSVPGRDGPGVAARACARAAPSTTFLPKPIEPSRLVEVVRTLLDGEPGPAGRAAGAGRGRRAST
jgi:CheY-like chemotaxis protein